MPAIIRPEKWQERPRGTLILDQGHWAFGAIVHALCPGQALVDLKTGIAPTKGGTPEIVGTPEGPAISSIGSVYRYYEFADSPQNSNSRMMVVARWSGTGATNEGPASKRVVFGQGWNLAGSFNALLGANYPAFGFFDGSGWRTASGTEDIRSAGLVTLAGGYDGNVITLSAKGRTYTTAFSGSIPDVAVSVKIGGDGGDVVSGGTTSLFYLIDGNRLRSSTGAVEELAKAPWQVFRKQAKILYFPSAGGGATIAGALESLTLSTFGATVGSARAVAAALESLALTTSAARVSSDRAITASVESISITTSPARIASDRAVAAATEQLTVTPATASVALVSGIAAGTEALSVTANPATVALAASIAATLEAITVTGLTATVSTSSNTNISAALESITVTVNPATVSRNTALAAALESLTVTPHAASIAVGQIVAAALESLTLTSYPAGIALDVAIAAQLEQINLTTLAAQVGLGTNVAALTEALTLTPHGATLTFAPSVGAATEYITLTTFAAVVGATEAALLSPGLEFTIPLSRLGYTIPLSRVHFTIPQE